MDVQVVGVPVRDELVEIEARIELQDIRFTGNFADRVQPHPAAHQIGVGSAAAGREVVPARAVDDVVTGTAVDDVGELGADKTVRKRGAGEFCLRKTGEDSRVEHGPVRVCDLLDPGRRVAEPALDFNAVGGVLHPDQEAAARLMRVREILRVQVDEPEHVQIAVAPTLHDHVGAATPRKDIGVVSAAAFERVIAGAAVDDVIALCTVQIVIAAAAVQHVVGPAPEEAVVAGTALKQRRATA